MGWNNPAITLRVVGGDGGGGELDVREFNWATLLQGIWMWGPGTPGSMSLKWDSNIWLSVLRDPEQWVMCNVQSASILDM
jgi:hypothetical protein